MRILVAPNPFKGTLASWEAADAIEAGLRDGGITDEILKLPLADGGEGTAEILFRTLGGTKIPVPVKGPLFEPRIAEFVLTPDGRTAILDMASASGLPLVPTGLRNPLETTTFGAGELLARALRENPEEILVGVGGSATVDGGIGVAVALGARPLASDGRPLEGRGKDLLDVTDVLPPPPFASLPSIQVITDVNNVLCGPDGAAAVFGPQKGATPDQVRLLDSGLSRWAALLERKFDLHLVDRPGMGASGGLPLTLVAFLKARIVAGASFILDRLGFDARLRGSGLLITGEGRLDASTFHGKGPAEAVRRAVQAGIRTLFIAGSCGPRSENILQFGVERIIEASPSPPRDPAEARRFLHDSAARAAALILNPRGARFNA